MPNMRSLFLTVQKLKRRLKLATDKQTKRQKGQQEACGPFTAKKVIANVKVNMPRSFQARDKNIERFEITIKFT